MVGLKRYIVALPIVYLIFATLASHVYATNNFCSASVDEELCENMVKGAPNWDEAITNAVTEAMNELVKASKSGDSVCEKAYKDAEKKLMESIETVRKGDKDNSLNIQLSAALTSLEDCTHALKDLKQDDSAAKALNHGVEQAIRVCLTVETSKSTVSSKSATSNTPSYTIIS